MQGAGLRYRAGVTKKTSLESASTSTVLTVAVLFVPQTQAGVLADRLRRAEMVLGLLLGDKSWLTLRSSLHRSNSWAEMR